MFVYIYKGEINVEKNFETIEPGKYNSKLYPIYKAISWDLLFYYAISFLFLTRNKRLKCF